MCSPTKLPNVTLFPQTSQRASSGCPSNSPSPFVKSPKPETPSRLMGTSWQPPHLSSRFSRFPCTSLWPGRRTDWWWILSTGRRHPYLHYSFSRKQSSKEYDYFTFSSLSLSAWSWTRLIMVHVPFIHPTSQYSKKIGSRTKRSNFWSPCRGKLSGVAPLEAHPPHTYCRTDTDTHPLCDLGDTWSTCSW